VAEGGCDVPAEGVGGEGDGYPHDNRRRRDAGNRTPELGAEEPPDALSQQPAQREDVHGRGDGGGEGQAAVLHGEHEGHAA